MSKIKPALTVLALLALGAATTALAISWDYEGGGTGDPIPGGIGVPFSTWEGTLEYSDGYGSFSGFWGENEDNWMLGDATKVGYYYYVEQGTWYYNRLFMGNWTGYFWTGNIYPPGDTVYGDWWVILHAYEGTFWGDLADD